MCSPSEHSVGSKKTRSLLIRCNEHLGINRNGRKIATPILSFIWDHIKQTGHTASIDDFQVINKIDTSYDLLIHESLIIQ